MGRQKKSSGGDEATSASSASASAGSWSHDLSKPPQDFGSNADRAAQHTADTEQTLRVAIVNSKEGYELMEAIRAQMADQAVADAEHNASWTDEPGDMALRGRFDTFETTIHDFNWNGSTRDVKVVVGFGGTLWADKVDKGMVVSDTTWAAEVLLSVDAEVGDGGHTSWKETGWVDFNLVGNDMTGMYMTRDQKHDFTPDF